MSIVEMSVFLTVLGRPGRLSLVACLFESWFKHGVCSRTQQHNMPKRFHAPDERKPQLKAQSRDNNVQGNIVAGFLAHACRSGLQRRRRTQSQ